jgi:membrane associated rhomboid family serine protease
VAFYAIFELYAGIRNSESDNIAHFAHLGGMLVAFIIINVWNKTNRKSLY